MYHSVPSLDMTLCIANGECQSSITLGNKNSLAWPFCEPICWFYIQNTAWKITAVVTGSMKGPMIPNAVGNWCSLENHLLSLTATFGFVCSGAPLWGGSVCLHRNMLQSFTWLTGTSNVRIMVKLWNILTQAIVSNFWGFKIVNETFKKSCLFWGLRNKWWVLWVHNLEVHDLSTKIFGY